MLMIRLQDLLLIKERSSHPLDIPPLITQSFYLIGLASSLPCSLIFYMSQGAMS